MKLETSEADVEAVKARIKHINSQGWTYMLNERVYVDFIALLAEVERLRAEYELAGEQINELETEAEASSAEIANLRKELDATPPAPPLPAEVEEMQKRLDAIAENYGDVLGTAASEHLRSAASLLSRWPGGWRPMESAPHAGSCILESAEGWVGEAWFSEDADGWWAVNTHPTDAHDGQVLNPTGWMPLPNPGAAK